ncbi:MAG TPA: cytochrome c maturation protein CcmE [Candidatus Binataceae bacterium]
MSVRPRFLIGAGLVVAAVGYLIVTAIQNTSEYYLTVTEVSTRQAALAGQPLRVAGRVKPDGISWDPATLTLRFAIAPIPDPSEGVKPVAASVPQNFRVVCAGQPKPDMFAAGRDVIVEGRLGKDGSIIATQVMTSCPSKYRPSQAK